MEEGEIPSSETISAETKEEEIHAFMIIPPMSPINERNKKSLKGSTPPGGTWEEMVKHRKVTPQDFSPKKSSSQGSQELHDIALQPNTRGRKSQRYHREQEAEREMELGRQCNIK